MTPVAWRRAGMADADALAVLGSATFYATFAHDHPGEGLIAHVQSAHSPLWYRTALADPNIDIVIGETPMGALVAYAVLTPNSLPVAARPNDLEIKRFYLLAPWQGVKQDGISHGDALMAEMFAAAARRNAGRLLLAVYPQNHKAQRFYARHGLRDIGSTTFMVGDVPFEDRILVRDL